MKDVIHHRRHVQRKVLQSIRKEQAYSLLKSNQTILEQPLQEAHALNGQRSSKRRT